MERCLDKDAAGGGDKLGVTAVLLAPSRVYRSLKQRGTLHRLLWGFFGAALLHGIMTGVIAPDGGGPMFGTVAVFNTLGMALITAFVSWLALWLVGGRRPTFAVVVPCVAYGFGVTLLVSWIPGSFWYTEPWKWGVIGTGFRELGEITGRRAGGTVLVTVGALVILFKWMFMMQGV